MNTEMIGMTLGKRYRLEAILGEGGMGTVFSAEDLLLGRVVAVKLMREDLANDRECAERIIREAKVIAQLSLNPQILTIHDLCFTESRVPYIVEERLHGRSLRALMRDNLRPSRSWVIEVGLQTALALIDVHGKGITHRDLKPGNLFVVETPAIPLLLKVIDFGISRSPHSLVFENSAGRQTLEGTLRYLAPEVIAGHQATAAADIYAFGIILFELATGGYPFETMPTDHGDQSRTAAVGATPRTECARSFPADAPDFPASFRDLVLKMIAEYPLDRPSTEECLSELQRANRDLDSSKTAT